MSFLSPPKAPDPYQSSQQQLGFNTQAAQQQQQINMVGQTGPYGALSWMPDTNSPGGYTATQTLSPAQQQLLNLQQTAQTGAGTAASGLGGMLAGLYGQPPNLDTQTMTNQLMDWQTQSMQPYWDIQKSNLEAQLQNQGLTPGSEAWQNSMMAFEKGIGQARNEMFAQAEPLAFGQAITKYGLPMDTMNQLLRMSQPQGQSYISTPQEQVGSPNYQQQAQNQYLAQQQQYNNMIKGIGQVAGVAAAPFTGGASLFSMMPTAGGWGNMFASAPTVAGGSF